MSSETPPGPPTDRPTEPFTRGRIQWGRPPQTVFQVSSLPGGAGAATQAQSPARPRSRAAILTGSMIPSAPPAAAPADPVEAVTSVEPEAIVTPPPPEPEPEPVVLTPEPVVPEPEPTPAPQEIVIEPEAAEPAVTAPPPPADDAPAAGKPRELPSVVVTPTLYAAMGATVQKVTKGDRWTIVAGVAALLVIGGFIWLATLPAPQPIDQTPTPLAAGAPVLEGPPPAEIETPAAAAPPPTPTAPAVAASSQPATPAPRRPAPTPAAPVRAAPPPATTEAAPRPYIETAPLVVEPPTPAAPAQTDPDAPIATQPQPLD